MLKQNIAYSCCYYKIENDMKTTVKRFLVLILLALIYIFNGSAIAIDFTRIVNRNAITCDADDFSSLRTAPTHNVTCDTFTNIEFAFWADVELANNSISETYLFHTYRFRKSIEMTFFLRLLSHYQNVMVYDQSKLYYSDKNPHYVSFSTEYYVYALRQIII